MELTKGNVSSILGSLASLSALLQDAAVYYTYITSQDANSNPAVKFVREITAVMFDIIKAKKCKSGWMALK